MSLCYGRILNYTLSTMRGLVPAHSLYLPSHPLAMLTEIYIESLDEELLDLIEAAFRKGVIDGETQELAYIWLDVNRPCEQ